MTIALYLVILFTGWQIGNVFTATRNARAKGIRCTFSLWPGVFAFAAAIAYIVTG